MLKKRHTRGFSLIELLFAMLFLSVIVFGVIKLQTSNVTLSHTKQMELKAHFYAAQALEIAEALNYAEINACTVPCYFQNSGDYTLENSGTESLENDMFQRYIEHSPMPAGSASLVTAIVEWTDSSGDHSVEAKRVISN